MNRKILLAILFLLHSALFTQTIRPIRDDIGFCWNAEEMNRFVNWLDKNSSSRKNDFGELVAAISVHDDYLYAGKIYYPLFKQVKTKEVVIFGVKHGTVRKEIGTLKDVVILDEFDKWTGPYGNIEVSSLREIIKQKLGKNKYLISNKAHEIEHSIEAELPFLQYYNRDIKITPVMVTQMTYDKMRALSNELAEIFIGYMKDNNLKLGKDIFFLISNDANHYGEDFNNFPYGLDLKAHETATNNDRRIIDENLTGNLNAERIKILTKEIWPDSASSRPIPLWCGRYPITLGLLTVDNLLNPLNKTVEGILFNYSDTLTEKVIPFENTSMGLTAVFSPKHWCGWFTLGYYLR